MTTTIPQQLAKRCREYLCDETSNQDIEATIHMAIPLVEYEALRVAAEPFVRDHAKVIQTTRCEDALYKALSALNEKLKGME